MTISFFAATDVKVHRHLRSRVLGAYSMTSILSMEPLVKDVLDLNLRRLQGFADSGEVIRMDQWANYFTFDVVGQLAMGGMIGFLEEGRDVAGIIGSIHDGFWLMANMGNIPLQTFWFNNSVSKWLVKKFGGKRLNAFDVFLEWLEQRVDERMRNGLGDARRDMLQHFVEAKDPSGQPVKKGDVMIEGVNILR
jgi:cytochrome P450